MAIVNGIGYDPWAPKLIAANPVHGRVVLTVGDLLGIKPVRSELTYLLVMLDKQYLRDTQGESWEDYYAARILQHFSRQS